MKARDYSDMSEMAAEIVFKLLIDNERKVLGLATGGTPEGFYRFLVKKIQANSVPLNDLYTVNLDEYIGLSAEDPNSYHQYMKENLFQYLQISKGQTHLPNGDAEDIIQECTRYEQLIHGLGGIDLQVLGVGSNGHIGFNEPGSSFEGRTQVVDLATSTVEANARFFENEDEVPRQAITMGIKTIMESKNILLLASGVEKAEAIYQLVHGEVTEDCPVTVLQKHSNVTVIADEKAGSLLKNNLGNPV